MQPWPHLSVSFPAFPPTKFSVKMASSALVGKPMVAKPAVAAKASRRSTVAVRAAGAPAMVPDMTKRTVMNVALAGAAALPVGYLAYGYASFFIPPSYVHSMPLLSPYAVFCPDRGLPHSTLSPSSEPQFLHPHNFYQAGGGASGGKG